MMTGNAGTVAITVNCAQSAHCLMSWGHFSTKDWNAKRHYSQNALCSFQRDRLVLMFSSQSSLFNLTFIISCRGAVGPHLKTIIIISCMEVWSMILLPEGIWRLEMATHAPTYITVMSK